MGMTSAMEDVIYDRKNFNYDPKLHRHPLYTTDRHIKHHLVEDSETGYLRYQTNADGKTISSPRRLRDICINKIVTEPKLLSRNGQWQQLPGTVYQPLLGEAMLLRETQAIVWLVSYWPTRVLRVLDIVPAEDTLEDDYMTKPFERNTKMTLTDCFVFGLLKLKNECNLKLIDFSGFEKDRKLCRELSRLPILWMKPGDRKIETIHDIVSQNIDITKDKMQRFLNRISVVYGNVDADYKHGNKIDPVTVFLDLQILIDDVPIGLSLQHLTPFRFTCSRLWLTPVKEVGLDPRHIGVLLDPKRITHFEYRHAADCGRSSLLARVIEAIPDLPNLFAVSLPSALDITKDRKSFERVNATLSKLKYLQRLNFSYCNLKGGLSELLQDLKQRIVYLNVTDCRLDDQDLDFLSRWRSLHCLRELNLSYNDLQSLDGLLFALLDRLASVTCLSVACCSLSKHCLVSIAKAAKQFGCIKVLGMVGYTPLPEADLMEILHICAQIRTLQKFIIFPQAYAFPGANEQERELNKLHSLAISYRYLTLRKRPDIALE